MFNVKYKGVWFTLMGKKSEKFTTLADISNLVGVSTTTVSRYLNGKYQYMSEETQDKIRAAVDELGYHPNNLARGLKSNQTKSIGVILAEIESPFSASVVKGIFDACQKNEYSIVILNSDNCLETEKKNIQTLLEQRVDGLIVNTTDKDNPFLVDLAKKGFPILLMDRFVDGYPFDIVYIECDLVVKQSISHMMNAGYKRIACFVPEYQKISPRFMRRNAFIKEMMHYGIESPEDYVFIVDKMDISATRNGILRLLDMTRDIGPTSIFACTGVTLFSVCNAICTLNLRMPNQIGLCGMDDWGWTDAMNWAQMVPPGITTMSAPIFEVGSKSVEVLLKRMGNESLAQQVIALNSELVVRNSTKLSF